MSLDNPPSNQSGSEGNSGPQYIFVYGTLKRNIANPIGAMMRAHANYLAEAIIAGRIYDLGPYPGLILEDCGTAVYGELYEIVRPNALLSLLDAYEGCSDQDQHPHEFSRVLATVRDNEGVDYRAWVYVYQGAVDPQWVLTSGYYQPSSGAA